MERLTERLENGVINVKYASQHETAIHRLAAIEDILGDEYDLDELREMVQAKRDVRCVVLPCKIGDTVYSMLKRLELVEMGNYGFTLGVQMGVNHAIQCVKEEPAADVVEVRHGRWKNGGNGLYDTCSVCGKEIYLAIPMSYCPECGAQLDGKEDGR